MNSIPFQREFFHEGKAVRITGHLKHTRKVRRWRGRRFVFRYSMWATQTTAISVDGETNTLSFSVRAGHVSSHGEAIVDAP